MPTADPRSQPICPTRLNSGTQSGSQESGYRGRGEASVDDCSPHAKSHIPFAGHSCTVILTIHWTKSFKESFK